MKQSTKEAKKAAKTGGEYHRICGRCQHAWYVPAAIVAETAPTKGQVRSAKLGSVGAWGEDEAMSIWASQFTLDTDHPLGPPFAVDYPPVDTSAPEAWVDVATARHYAEGWARLHVVEEDGLTEAMVMLSPPQVQALADYLKTLHIDGSRDGP